MRRWLQKIRVSPSGRCEVTELAIEVEQDEKTRRHADRKSNDIDECVAPLAREDPHPHCRRSTPGVSTVSLEGKDLRLR